MKTLYFDCAMGAAGDMIAAALLELLDDQASFLDRLNHLGLPGVAFEAETAQKCGIIGTHLRVSVCGEEEAPGDAAQHKSAHEHYHEHHHAHHHGLSMPEISELVYAMQIPEAVQSNILAVYQKLAAAESAVHGVPVENIHFHEVGTLDALADITAVCLLMDELHPAQVIVSPIHVGIGFVRCAHGILPVPAPATAQLLLGVPIYQGQITGELCTPTGAALLTHFANRFDRLPPLIPARIGYGMGTKDFPAANCLRVFWGEATP